MRKILHLAPDFCFFYHVQYRYNIHTWKDQSLDGNLTEKAKILRILLFFMIRVDYDRR